MAGRSAANRVGDAGAEQVGAQLRQGRAINFRKLNLQQHFLRAHWAKCQNVDHFAGIRLGDHARALRHVFRGNMSGQDNRVPGRRDVDLLVRKNPVFFLGRGGDIHIHAKVKTP